jgi:hypothetical protein
VIFSGESSTFVAVKMTNGRRLLMNIIIWGFLSFSQHGTSLLGAVLEHH